MRNVLCNTCSDALVANPEVGRKLEFGQRFNDVQARRCSIHRYHPGDSAPGSDRKTDSDGKRSEEWPPCQTTPLMPLHQNPSATHSIMLTPCAPFICQNVANSGFSVCLQDRQLDFIRAWHSELAHPCNSLLIHGHL